MNLFKRKNDAKYLLLVGWQDGRIIHLGMSEVQFY